jgi:Flp pilus assembly protein TadG
MMRERLLSERGAAAVEFALVLPILVLLVTGIIEFSRAYSAKEALQYAVREGARELAINNVPGDAVQAVKDSAIELDQLSLNVPAPASCPASPSATDKATVTATYDLTYNIPLFSSGTWTLEATGVMRCNG